MSHWQINDMSESHRHRIIEEMEQIRLEDLALQSRIYRPRFFARTMFTFANWMISTGKQLRKRYEIPAVNGSNTESFAH